MKQLNIQATIFLGLAFFISSCGKSPNDGIPAYIAIDAVSFNTTAAQGSNYHFINTVWVESEGEDLGAYELPNKIPILKEGSNQIIINAGVFQKGDYNNREIYPAYQPFKTTVNLVPGEIITLNPVFEYYDEVFFPLSEDFTNGNIFAGTNRTDVNDVENREGRAMHLELTTTNDYIKTQTSSAIGIPFGAKVYIEMDYKGSNDFALGIEALNGGIVTESGYIDVFAFQDDWYKIYYDISTVVNSLDADSYNFFIEALMFENTTESDVYIDNFKIVVI